MSSFVRFENVGKLYHSGDVKVHALRDISFEVEKGDIGVIVGQSGAGKTTLLNILGGMDTLTYKKVFGQECSYKTAFALTDSSQIYDIFARLMNDYGASNVLVTADTRSRVTNMMKSLNYIVWLVIACACALSFVVMYNLSNINITERNRENIVITIISIVVGLQESCSTVL